MVVYLSHSVVRGYKASTEAGVEIHNKLVHHEN